MIEKQKILIVDDTEANLVALKNILSETDTEIVCATNGNDALKATLNADFAIAILDVQMSPMNGFELAEFLRSAEKTKFVPIIFLSAVYSDDYHVFKGYRSRVGVRCLVLRLRQGNDTRPAVSNCAHSQSDIVLLIDYYLFNDNFF